MGLSPLSPLTRLLAHCPPIAVSRLLIAFGLWMFAGLSLAADASPTAADVARLVGELDSDRFEVRQRAAERLEELVAKPELGQLMADEFQQALVRPDVSFEVRWRLGRWTKRLPAPQPGLVGDASPEELDQLVRQLDDDSYSVRLGATQRIEWLTNNPKLVCPLLIRLKARLAEAGPGVGTRQQLETMWQRVRGLWLLSDPVCPGSALPAISGEQIEDWLDVLVRVAPSAEAAKAQAAARRELLDALARDECVPQVTVALQDRLKRSPEAAATLQELLDWTKPALVAEYWHGGRQLVEQHLLVDVPTRSPGAPHETHFDRIDDRVAHYVKGVSLVPDTDYPVNVAIPHPKQEGAFFCLVNLPTPRRRMAYPCRVQIDESKRLAALSRRTVDRFLAEKHPLTEPEVLMIGELDPVEVSRFAGQYFLLIEDERFAESGLRPLGGHPSRFGMICLQLAFEGTKEALPGLTDAIAKNVFLPPDSRAPYRLHWLAAFSIASRDPWPEVDAWLAGLIEADRKEAAESLAESGVGSAEAPVDINRLAGGAPSPFSSPRTESGAAGAEVAATAAALLLVRHGHEPSQFDLQPVADPFLTKLHVDGYHFSSDEARAKVRQWWEQEKGKQKAP